MDLMGKKSEEQEESEEKVLRRGLWKPLKKPVDQDKDPFDDDDDD
jgi:hypothetical protein